MRISDWSSDVCSSDLLRATQAVRRGARAGGTASRDRRSVLPQAAQDDDATGRAPSRIAPPATYESGGRPRGRPFCSRARDAGGGLEGVERRDGVAEVVGGVHGGNRWGLKAINGVGGAFNGEPEDRGGATKGIAR